jgi:hypothetical protein
MADTTIPAAAQEKIRAFLLAQKTGNISLDVKEGAVMAWKITEHGRIEREPGKRMTE